MTSPLESLCRSNPGHLIQEKRQEIMNRLMRSSARMKTPRISTLSTDDLYLLYDLYDSVFFDNQFKRPGLIVNFSLSRRMTKSAGKTIWEKQVKKEFQSLKVFEIRIGVDFFFNYDLVEGNKRVCGIETRNSLEALLLVFEHELCHVLEHLCFGDTDCSRERFQTLAANLFGHASSHHELPTHKQIACQELGLRPGDPVSFSFEGRQLHGFIHKINKRATVMVKNRDGIYRDTNGVRYQKYYVPLKLLSPIRSI